MPVAPNSAQRVQSRRLVAAVCILLVTITWLVFGQTLWHGFVNYDDDAYVHLQPEIVSGLTLRGVAWAFTHLHSGNWHPLTSITHMLDCELHGLGAAGHHFTNLVLHSASAVLLFLALRNMTGRLWRCAFVAVLFAIHPLRVESVAWIAERKDVLSGLFFMLTLLSYACYVRGPSPGRYLLFSIAFCLGLLSKPTLVTLPFVLLLLDYWPLKRAATPAKLFLEKIPLLLLSAGTCVMTILAQTGTISALERLPISWRIENAFLALLTYLGQMLWPAGLAVFYPHSRDQIPLWWGLVSAILVLAISFAALLLRQRRRYFPVGWFWYVGMLVPMLGLVQVGLQGHADRYTYLAQIGLYLVLTWLIADLSVSWKHREKILGAAAAIVIGTLATRAAVQTSFWRDSETLWRHALSVTKRNSVAHTNLGNLLPAREALPHYQEALAIDPDSTTPLNNLAWILAASPDESLRDGKRAVQLAHRASQLSGGGNPLYLRTLSVAYAEAGRFGDATKFAERALPLAVAEGNSALAHDLRNNLAGYRLRQPVRDSSLTGPSSVPQ